MAMVPFPACDGPFQDVLNTADPQCLLRSQTGGGPITLNDLMILYISQHAHSPIPSSKGLLPHLSDQHRCSGTQGR